MMGLALVAAFVPVRSAAAERPGEAAPKIVTTDYDLRGFDGIDASWVYKIELTQSSRYAVRVEAPDFIVPYLRIDVSGDRLRLSCKPLSRSLQRKMNREEVRVYVSMPDLSYLELSGAARLQSKGAFRNRRGNFKMDLSGAVNVIGLEVVAENARIDCSGAAKFSFAGDFDTMDMEYSGAVKGAMDATAKKVFLDVSGAANLDLALNAETVVIGGSGAGDISLAGKADQLKAEGSGAMKIYAEKMPVQHAKVDLSGASMVRVNATHTLDVDLSGASHCRYRDNPGLRISRSTVARGSSLTAF